jgi:regulation of enolase protein 1 (concanavalin A-like superfamily)
MYSENRSVEYLLDQMNPDGSWQDRALDTYVVEQRVLRMAQVYYEDPSWRNNTTLKEAIYQALFYYFENIDYDDYVANWPAQGLRVPRGVGMIANLMHDDIYADRNSNPIVQAVYAHILATFQKAFENIIDRPGNVRGANLSSRLRGATYIAAFAHSTSMMNEVAGRSREAMEQGAGRGTQGIDYPHLGITTDFSFHQHNADGGQSIWGNYGGVWLDELGKFMQLVGGSDFDMSQAQYQLVYDAITQGWQYFVYRTEKVYAVEGRKAFRPGQYGGGAAGVVRRIVQAAPAGIYTAEQSATLDRIEQNFRRVVLDPTLHHSKHFFASDITVHARENHHLMIRMQSNRTAGLEQGIGLNVQNYHMSHGLAMLMKDGKEYTNARLGWNVAAIPGITAEQTTVGMPLQARTGNTNALNTFAGGVSDGVHTVSGFDLHKAQTDYFTVRANKGYFLADDVFAFLGSAVTQAGSPGEEVWTTLEQNEWRGNVVYHVGSGQQTIAPGSDVQRSFTASQPIWFHHNGTGYIILPHTNVNVRLWAETRRGRWHDLDEANGAASGYENVEIFHLAINHGTNPQQDKYQYLVVPEIAASEMPAYVNGLSLQIARNDDQVQAVWNETDQIAQALFFASGQTVAFPHELILGNDGPAVVMVEKTTDSLIFHVADPHQNRSQIQLTVNQQLEGSNATYNANTGRSTITVNLPTGIYSGKQVRLAFAANGTQAPPPVADPVPRIDYTTSQAYAPVTVNFDATNSYDDDGNITDYFWDLGDGNIGTGLYISHTYVTPGTYTVSLTLRDNDNRVATDTVNVVVYSPSGTSSDPSGPSDPTPPATCLGGGWGNGDVGNVGVAGEACESNGTFTLKASGENIWDQADGFHYAYKRLVGDGEIIARVVSADFSENWASTGVMMRESLDAGSAFAYANLTDYGRYALLFRNQNGASASTRHSGNTTVSTPYWVRLTREGDRVESHFSHDGNNWSYWRATSVPMTDTVYIGLATFSHDNNQRREAKFDQVSMGGNILDVTSSTVPTSTGCLPGKWLSSDIGNVGVAGDACESSGTFTINASGEAIWGTEDGFHYVYQQMKGDGEIIARVTGLENLHNWGAAGVMMRESLAPGSPHVNANITAAGRYAMNYREQVNGTSTARHSGSTMISLPYYVRLVREGSMFYSYFSTDGQEWEAFRSVEMSMQPIIFVGLATTSHANTQLAASTYDQVQLDITSPVAGTLPVELMSFSAVSNPFQNRVDLRWETATEVNNSHFIIERSLDGRVFGAIGQVSGAGNSVSTQRYEAFDTDPELGDMFYRLRQTDFDGSFQYSNVVEVAYSEGVQSHLSAYPIPAHQGTEIQTEFFLPGAQEAIIQVINQAGQVMDVSEYPLLASAGEVQISTEHFTPGLYLIHVFDKDQTDVYQSTKMIILPR